MWVPLLRLGASKPIDLETDSLVPNQASAELPTGTCMIADLWEMPGLSRELLKARAHGTNYDNAFRQWAKFCITYKKTSGLEQNFIVSLPVTFNAADALRHAAQTETQQRAELGR